MMQLTTSDLYFAAQAGIMRRISAIRANRPEPYGALAEDLWGNDIESCAAEMLVARAFGVNWIPYANNPQSITADVGDNIQVRSTRRDNGCLLLHKEDKDDHIYVLVTGSGIQKRIRGCILGSDGKRSEYWRESTGRPCYFVPQSKLSDIADMRHG